MLSAGMLTDFASAITVRRRGLVSGSPPPFLAATASSLMMRVNTFPRFASAAPFLCLMVCHFEWPDMAKPPESLDKSNKNDRGSYHAPSHRPNSALAREHDPDVGARVPWTAAVVAEDRVHGEARPLQALHHLRHRQRPERQRESMLPFRAVADGRVELIEDRQPPRPILAHGLDQTHLRVPSETSRERLPGAVLLPLRQVGDEIDPEPSTLAQHARDRREGVGEIAFARERLEDPVRRHDEPEATRPERQGPGVGAAQPDRA